MGGVVWVPALLALVATGAGPAQPDASEDREAALLVLDGLEQPPTEAELSVLLGEGRDDPGPRHGTGRAGMRWETDVGGNAGRAWWLVGTGPAWATRARLRQPAGGARVAAVSVALRAGPWTSQWGSWTWGQGFGLLCGTAGRAGALAADGGLAPSRAGARGWTGWPDPRAARGGAVGVVAAGWSLEAAAGIREPGGGPRWLACAGRRSGTWRVATVADQQGALAAGACGAWRSGPWSGTWELAVPAAAGPCLPASGVHLAWRRGRRLRVEALALLVPQGPVSAVATVQPLLGSAAGALWALRATVRSARGARLGVLVAGADRDATATAGPERRLMADVAGQGELAGGIFLDCRLRVRTGSHPVWSDEWPWTPPRLESARRSETATIGLRGRFRGIGWELRFRSYSVAHAANDGRRSLVAASLRDNGAGALRWRLVWRQAWGAPVDLADAVSPLPGLLVPRHWGRRSAGWFAAAGLDLGLFAVDAAVDLRERADGIREWEIWAAGEIGW